MYWDKEYNTNDRDVKHLLVEEGVVIGAFTGLLALVLIVGAVL